jgi:Cu/Ag efflux pump CusA
LPEGWWLGWGGQYENLERATNRLRILVPAALMLILVLLYNTFSSMRMALLIFGNVLLGASGGIFALQLRGLTFSITAGVGFITLFGMFVLNGVVLVSEINRVRESGPRHQRSDCLGIARPAATRPNGLIGGSFRFYSDGHFALLWSRSAAPARHRRHRRIAFLNAVHSLRDSDTV